MNNLKKSMMECLDEIELDPEKVNIFDYLAKYEDTGLDERNCDPEIKDLMFEYYTEEGEIEE